MTVFLHTQRLLLRKLDMADVHDFYNYRSMPEVYRYQIFRPGSIEDAKEFIKSLSETPDVPDTWFQLAVCLKENSRLIGDIGMRFFGNTQVETGVTLDPGFQGKGYASEALEAVFNYLFVSLKKDKVIASVDPDNAGSVRLLEKAGMRKEVYSVKSTEIDGILYDDCIFAILKDEWDQRRIIL